MKRLLLLFVLMITRFQLFATTADTTAVDTIPSIWMTGNSQWSYGRAAINVGINIPFDRTRLSRISITWGDGERTDLRPGDWAFLNTSAFSHTYYNPGAYRITLATIPVDPGQLSDTLQEITGFLRNPYVYVELPNDTTITEGDTLVLDAGNPGAQYQWSTGATTQQIKVTTAGFYRIFVLKNGDDHTDSIAVGVRRRDSTFAARIGIDSLRCRYAVFSDNTVSSYPIVERYWHFGDGYGDTTARPQHSYVSDGTYQVTLRVINSAGDTAYGSRLLYLNRPIIDLGPDASIRRGEMKLLDATKPRFSESATYTWSTGESSPRIYVSSPGTYAVWASYCGSYIQDTINISYVPDTLVKAGFSSLRTGCTTFQFTDTSKVAPGAYITRWNWSFSDNTTDTAQHPVHTFPQQGNYTAKLVVTDNYGHQDTISRYVITNSQPFVNLGPDSTQWSGRTTLGTTIFLNPDYRYLWSTGDTTATITVTQDGIYWVRITERFCGMTASDTIRLGITTADTLIAQIGIDSIRCNMVAFRDSSFARPPAVKWEWNFGDGGRDTTRNPLHTFVNNGTYTVSLKITNSKGQVDTASRTIAVYNKPFVYLGADTALLPGDSLLLDATRPVYSYFASYRWSTGETSPQIRAAAPGVYHVTVSYCGAAMADTITLTTLPVADIGPVTNIHANDSIPVTAQFRQPLNANNVFTVQLLRETSTGGRVTEEGDVTDLMIVPGSSQRVAFNVNIPDTVPCSKDYRIRVISSSPADTVAWSQKFEVVNRPVATLQQRGDSLFAGKALSYQWSLNNTPVPGANAAAIRAKANGVYQVALNNGGDCRATAGPINVMITSVSDVNAAGSGVKAFPNPTDGIVHIRFEKPLLKPVRLAVHDTYGNTVLIKQVQDQTPEIDLSALPKGVYYLQITGYEQQRVMRIILQ